MKFAIIVGSHREESQSSKVGRFIEYSLKNLFSDAEVYTLDLKGNPLPLWDEGVWKGDEKWKSLLGPILSELESSDALIIIAPEWNGMAPPALKNFFLFPGQKHIGHKPALLVTVSASRGGSYPISELRASGYKNNRLCYIPEHVIIREVNTVLNDPGNPAGPDDTFFHDRIAFALKILERYGEGLRLVRETGELTHPDFGHGM